MYDKYKSLDRNIPHLNIQYRQREGDAIPFIESL